MSGINIRLVVTQRDIKIITTALRDYSKNHPKPNFDAYEAESLAELINNQAKRQNVCNDCKVKWLSEEKRR